VFDRAPRPRLRTVLLIVNLAILALPLAGISGLRLYENELIRGTESQLLYQGTIVREMFLLGYREASGAAGRAAPATVPVDAAGDALLPSLDIATNALLPPAPPATKPELPVDAFAAAAGSRILAPLRAAVRATLVGIRVTDAAGIVVASSGSELGLTLAARVEVARALRGETVSLLRRRVSEAPEPPLASVSRGQRYRVFVALPVRDGTRVIGTVVLSRTPLDISKAMWLSRRPIFIGASLVVAVVLLVTALTSLTINRPLYALVERARRVARGDRGALAASPGPGTREVAQLWDAVTEMAQTLEERAGYIRTFASHVSHEFKTPLTTLRGSLELLRDHGDTMSRDERARFLANAQEAALRLDRLVRRLLELARADVARPGDPEADLRGVVDGLTERYARAGFRVIASVGEGAGTVAMSGEILDEILTNLVDNARQHGGDVASVRLDARPVSGPSGPAVEVLVADDGHGVSDANVSRIFTPFFTTARERGGSGLGLSIVRSLLAAHGGSIEYISCVRGASFRLVIPAIRARETRLESPA
jgi:signal transduction histidine kinase